MWEFILFYHGKVFFWKLPNNALLKLVMLKKFHNILCVLKLFSVSVTKSCAARESDDGAAAFLAQQHCFTDMKHCFVLL